ncbi:MAG: ACP S-malonyltransferase [Magnetococcales bacterium]|nr:ACP S-malonyltransferase [Magnetococcales bacterium]
MGELAVVFPGQGSQSVGMGRSLMALGGPVAQTFEEADAILGMPLSRHLLEGPEEFLTRTENTQPALLTTGVAAWRMLQRERAVQVSCTAGHSLGEYAALVAAEVLSFADALRLVRLRGLAMRDAVPSGIGAMAAMLNMAEEDVVAVCEEASRETGQVCVAANFNSPVQIVISGHRQAVEKAVELAKGKGAKRCIMLAVSGPFHSPLMQPAAEKMEAAFAEVVFRDPVIPVVCNVTASAVTSATELRARLVQQITHAVQWQKSMQYMVSLGVDRVVELGTGKVLSGLMKRIDGQVASVSVQGPEELAAFDALGNV